MKSSELAKLIHIESARVLYRKSFWIFLGIEMLFSILLIVDRVQSNAAILTAILADVGKENPPYLFPNSLFTSVIGIDQVSQFSTYFHLLLPFLACAINGSSIVEDMTSGYIVNIIVRSSRKAYYRAKYIVSAIYTCISVAALYFLNFLLTAMFIPALLPREETFTFGLRVTRVAWMHDLYMKTPVLYIIIYILIASLFWGLFSSVPLAFSLITKSKAVVTTVPCLILFGWELICSMLGTQSASPITFTRMSQSVPAKPVLILVECCTLLAISIISCRIHILRSQDAL